MAIKIIKCKNCGAEIDISTAIGGVARCSYCNSTYALSNSSDEIQAALDFADGLLDVCEFDKAYSAFQKASGLNPKDPGAYFGMALAAHRIQYLRDCRKGNGLQPICHDINDKKFSNDANYLKAMALSTPEQCADYSIKAAEIDRIKSEFATLKTAGIKYDCFICVKVTDGYGRHTEDSHIAEKIYHSLKEAGYTPFYSEYDIHGQTGADYEARILYALFMSKSMFLICTDESYLQTPWVKNEYTRFISMMSDEQKERESLTVIFKDKPIERIPGLSGRIQGISINSFDALQRILNHVEAFRIQVAPELNRKEYTNIPRARKSAVRQTIAKRTLSSLGGNAEITVSDRSTLQNATGFLERGNFSAALNFADMLIKNNPSNSAAYRLRFLAENECKTSDEYIKNTKPTTSFDSIEKAIASADDMEQKTELYTLLYNHVKYTNNLDAFNEFVSLPDSAPNAVNTLTKQMFTLALDRCNTEIFNSAIKTVSDTDEYIRLNMEFARILLEKRGGDVVSTYYKCVLDVDEGNGEALWHTFITDNKIGNIFNFFSLPENYDKTETALFGYGYNDYATKELFSSCIANFKYKPNEACSLADFLLSMIPKNSSSQYKKYLKACRDGLMILNMPSLAKRYNDRIIAADKMDDIAHFNACLINHGYSNPLSILRLGENLLNDIEFRAAFDIYPEKHPDKPNPYMDIYTFVIENSNLLKYDSAFKLAEEKVRVEIFNLKNCKQAITDFYYNTAKAIYGKGLKKYHCIDKADIFRLREDVSEDSIWAEAYMFADAYSKITKKYSLAQDIKDIMQEQSAVSARNVQNDRKDKENYEQKVRGEKRDKTKRILLTLVKVLIYIGGLASQITMLMASFGNSFASTIWGNFFSLLDSIGARPPCQVIGIIVTLANFFGIVMYIGKERELRGFGVASIILSIIAIISFIVATFL